MSKSMTYLQFKSTADQLAHAGKTVTPDVLLNLLADITTESEVHTYYKKWLAEHLDETQTSSDQNTNRENELEKSLSITRATLESTADAILIVDKFGRLTDFNQKFLEMSQIPREVIESGEEGKGLAYIFTLIENPEKLVELMKYLMMHPEEDGDLGEVHFRNGKIVERYSKPHRLGNEIVGRVWSFRDVTEKRKQEELLRLSNRAISSSTHGVVIIDNNEDLTIVSVNPASLRLLNVTENEVLHHRFLTAFQCFKDGIEKFYRIFSEKKKGSLTVNYYLNDKPIWLEINIDPVKEKDSNKITHFVAIINDVTQNKELENILKYKAVHDALTGLPNKNYMEDAIKYRIKKDPDKPFGVLFIDIDRFKNINDTLGHRVGDKLLLLFGRRLRHSVQQNDIVSRVGGDEFIVLVNDISTIDALDAIAQRLLKSCRRRFNESDHEFNISASIGVVDYPDCGKDPDTLIRNADIAMYEAKQNGRNRTCFYSTSLNLTMSRRVEIENELHKAIQNQELELLFQPIYDIRKQVFNKAEALLRWRNAKIGPVSPTEFISVAEDIGMMTNIGRWVIETAAKQLKTWRDNGLSDLKISINVSPKQLMDENFVQHLQHTLTVNQIPPRELILELTESFFLLEGAILETISTLSDIGLKLSIDDFGTGYSNLSYLNQLHISYLKIDKTFIDQIEFENFNASVLLAIIAIAKEMRYGVVAEGVETKKQFDFLLKNDCNQIQGYYFSKPLKLTEFEKFIWKRARKRA